MVKSTLRLAKQRAWNKMTHVKSRTYFIFGFLIVPIFFVCLPAAHADRAGECSRLWQAERENGCPSMPSENSVEADPERPAMRDFAINSDFGPTKCVIEENIEKETRMIKKECADWKKDRQAELGSKYLAGTCNPQCSRCPDNELLKRCAVRGEVHYSLK